MASIDRQDDLLLQLVAADDKTDDFFFTAGTDVIFHDGLPGGQTMAPVSLVLGLASRGMVTITESRSGGDVAFVLTPMAADHAARLRSGGRTPVEIERDRAQKAEADLSALRAGIAARQQAEDDARVRRARRLAWVPAMAAAVLAGVILWALSLLGGFVAIVVGVLTAAGVAGSLLVPRSHDWLTDGITKVLKAIHDRT